MKQGTKFALALALVCALALSALCPALAESADSVLEKLTLEEKIGQLFVVRPEALWPGQYQSPLKEQAPLSDETLLEQPGASLTELTGEMRDGLATIPVGGIAIFGKNLESPEQLRKFIADFQAASKLPLLVAVDEEGGPVARLARSEQFDVPVVGPMEDIGNTGDPQNAYEAGRTIGAYISEYGFNLDFAPVADVNTNPENIVIGNRAFGSDPQLVAEMVSAALSGLHAEGVMGCLKHFPGHGDTKDDTHDGYVRVDKSWDELRQCELIPFIASLDQTDLVMMAHITAPNITGDGLPASLSREMIEGKLRGELGYDGAVITDALNMGAVAQNYESGEAAVLAIQAGVDILLMPEDLVDAAQAVREAVQSGEISEARLNESVRRILKLKEKYGLL